MDIASPAHLNIKVPALCLLINDFYLFFNIFLAISICFFVSYFNDLILFLIHKFLVSIPNYLNYDIINIKKKTIVKAN